jgi:hypothetical protein
MEKSGVDRREEQNVSSLVQTVPHDDESSLPEGVSASRSVTTEGDKAN